jgi:hypothetical protein
VSENKRDGPDWDRLCSMINELAARKGLLMRNDETIERAKEGKESERLSAISYRRMGTAIGKSSTILYGIIGRYHRPTAETLSALADYAAQEPRVDHLSDRGLWLKVGGVIKDIRRGVAPDTLDSAERRILQMLSDLTPEEKERLFDLIEAGKAVIKPRKWRSTSAGK